MAAVNPEAYLQYGALGLLGIVFVGVMWYVRNVETRQAARDELESEERRQFVVELLFLVPCDELLFRYAELVRR